MGTAMARRLCRQGHEVRVWNRTPQRAQVLAAEGAQVCTDPVEAVREAECIILMLSDSTAIDAVLEHAGMSDTLADRIVIQMGTIAPDQSRALARRLETSRAAYVEAPVLGSLPEAEGGKLLIMVGAEQTDFERVRGLLQTLGPGPRHVGLVGRAAALKLAFNQLIASLSAGFALSLGLVRREGASVDDFMEILRDSALYAPTFDKKLSRELARDFEHPNFPLKHLLKDTDLFLAAARKGGLDTAGLEGVRDLLARSAGSGLGELDYSALYALIDPAAPRT